MAFYQKAPQSGKRDWSFRSEGGNRERNRRGSQTRSSHGSGGFRDEEGFRNQGRPNGKRTNSPASRFSERNGNPVSSGFRREDSRSAEERKNRRFEDRRSPENFRTDSSRESGRRFEDRRSEDRRASGKPYAGSVRESALPPEERTYKDFEYRRAPETFHAFPEQESGRYEDRRFPERFHAGSAGEEPQDH